MKSKILRILSTALITMSLNMKDSSASLVELSPVLRTAASTSTRLLMNTSFENFASQPTSLFRNFTLKGGDQIKEFKHSKFSPKTIMNTINTVSFISLPGMDQSSPVNLLRHLEWWHSDSYDSNGRLQLLGSSNLVIALLPQSIFEDLSNVKQFITSLGSGNNIYFMGVKPDQAYWLAQGLPDQNLESIERGNLPYSITVFKNSVKKVSGEISPSIGFKPGTDTLVSLMIKEISSLSFEDINKCKSCGSLVKHRLSIPTIEYAHKSGTILRIEYGKWLEARDIFLKSQQVFNEPSLTYPRAGKEPYATFTFRNLKGSIKLGTGPNCHKWSIEYRENMENCSNTEQWGRFHFPRLTTDRELAGARYSKMQ